MEKFVEFWDKKIKDTPLQEIVDEMKSCNQKEIEIFSKESLSCSM